MAERTKQYPIAGGNIGWGGFVDRGNRIIAAKESSDCLNVYEQSGILNKRNGYVAHSGSFVLGGEYTPSSTGSQTLDSTNEKASQEVYLSGSGSGADIDFTGTETDIIVGLSLEDASLGANGSGVDLKIYSVDGSGHPDALLASMGPYTYVYLQKSMAENWIYFQLPKNITLGTNHICLVVGIATDKIKWHFSNGGSGYAPGGARVSAYWNGSSWVDISGTDFKFRFLYLDTSQNYKSIFQYSDLASQAQYTTDVVFYNTAETAYSPVVMPIKGYTAFIEGGYSPLEIESDSDITGQILHFPRADVGSTNHFQTRFIKSRIVFGSENYLFESAHNNWMMRIAYFATANNAYRFSNTINGTVIVPDKNAPQIWGSATYPISGDSGAMAFAGLTNPITLAQTVMWHGNRLWMGNVTINGVSYPNRIYFSDIGKPEEGWSDTGYFPLNGTVTSMVDMGDYAILADYEDTYLLTGGSGVPPFTSTRHDVSGGVAQQESLAIYRDKQNNAVVCGWGNKGIFKISKTDKGYVHEKVQNKIDDFMISDIFACADYQRGLMLFGYQENGTRKILAYNLINDTFWPEDLAVAMMIPVSIPTTPIPKVYGINGASWFEFYTGNNDDGDSILAYYKTGPAYLNNGAKFKPRKIWPDYRNEPNVSHLDIKLSNDYGTDVVKTIQNKVSGYPDNVPVRGKVDAVGEASSVEVTIYQDKISTTTEASSALNYTDHLQFLPVGHSYVSGTGSGLVVADNSYRREMWYRWRTRYGMEYDFVGSLSGGDFDSPYHNGVPGSSASDLDSNIDTYLDAAFSVPTTSDCVLLGPVDFKEAALGVAVATFKASITSIVSKIDAHSPLIKIFLITGPLVPNYLYGGTTPVDLQPYIDAENEVYATALAAGKNIYIINLSSTTVHIPLLTDPIPGDALHPDWLGYEQIGEYVTDQVATLLGIPVATPSILVRDTFTDTNGVLLKNHAPDVNVTGNVWSDASDRFEINTNLAHYISAADCKDTTIDTVQEAWTGQIKMYQTVAGTAYYIFKSNAAHTSFLYLIMQQATSKLYVYNEGGIYEEANFVSTLSTWYTFNIIVRGNSVEIRDVTNVPLLHCILDAPHNNLTNIGLGGYPLGTINFNDLLVYNQLATAAPGVNGAGQKILSVASTDGFLVGHEITINHGGAREESNVIASVGNGTLTLTTNLTYTHPARSDAVETYNESFAVSSLIVEAGPGQLIEQRL